MIKITNDCKFISAQDFAKMVGVSTQTVISAIRRNELNGIGIGQAWRVDLNNPQNESYIKPAPKPRGLKAYRERMAMQQSGSLVDTEGVQV